MADKTASELWQDYRFLTKELAKFLTKHDMELFYDLLSQRERLQHIIDKTADAGFKTSPEGRSLLLEISQDSRFLTNYMHSQINKHKQQQQLANAYSGQGSTVASQRNWQR